VQNLVKLGAPITHKTLNFVVSTALNNGTDEILWYILGVSRHADAIWPLGNPSGCTAVNMAVEHGRRHDIVDLLLVKGHAGRGTRWFRVTNSLY
jgi:hypothetical protein